LIGIAWEFVYIFIKILKSDCGCGALPVFLVGTIKKYQVRVHGFSEAFVVVKLRVVFASGDLLILLLDLEFLFSEIFANEDHGDVFLFGLPLEQSFNVALNDAFVFHMFLKLS
jgi:hypothetical protein